MSSARSPSSPRTPLLQSQDQHGQDSSVLLQQAGSSSSSRNRRYRKYLQWLLSSNYGHYFVMGLVTLDVAGIFADFLITLHVCEHKNEDTKWLEGLDEGLDVMSLVISCLFMLELLCSIYAFGFSYFKSKFHCFDATAIVASFLVDVLTRGPLQEAGSLIIVLRLFRVFKIVQESGTVATEELDGLREQIEGLEKENDALRRRSRREGDDSGYE